MIEKDIYPKDFIRDALIEKIGKIIHVDAYLSFSLICSGIEFLGKCLDSTNKWEDGFSGGQFKAAIAKLFPDRYHNLADKLYEELRCGLSHRFMPGSIALTQNSNDPDGEIKYENHPYIENGKMRLVIEYFYFDFVEACKKVLSTNFGDNNKMNTPILHVGILPR